MGLKNKLQEKTQEFIESYNKIHDDWHLLKEGEIFFEDKHLLLKSFTWQHKTEHVDAAYSVVYMFSESGEPKKIYSQQIISYLPEWFRWDLQIKEFMSVNEDNGQLLVLAKNIIGEPVEFRFKI